MSALLLAALAWAGGFIVGRLTSQPRRTTRAQLALDLAWAKHTRGTR